MRFQPYAESGDQYRGTTVLPYLETFYQYGIDETMGAMDRGFTGGGVWVVGWVRGGGGSVCVCVCVFMHLLSTLLCTFIYGYECCAIIVSQSPPPPRTSFGCPSSSVVASALSLPLASQLPVHNPCLASDVCTSKAPFFLLASQSNLAWCV